MRKATVWLVGAALVLSVIALVVIEPRPAPAEPPKLPEPSLPVAPPVAAQPPAPPPEPPAEKGVIVNGVEVAAPSLSPEQLAKALGVLGDLRTLRAECAAMPRKDDQASLSKCGNLMRANQPRAGALEQACSDLPIQLKLTLGQAATRLDLGCSCLTPAAEENLAMATKSLDEAAAILAR